MKKTILQGTAVRTFLPLIMGVVLCLAVPSVGQAAKMTKAQAEFSRALNKGDTAKVRELAAQGVDVNVGPMPALGSPLAMAAMKGDLEMVRTLIALGADVKATGKLVPLAAALTAKKNGKEIVSALLKAGASPTLPNGQSLLETAKLTGNTDMVNFLEETLPSSGGETSGSAAKTGAPAGAMRKLTGGQPPASREPVAGEIDGDGAYPPGLYSGPCVKRDSHESKPWNLGETRTMLYKVTRFIAADGREAGRVSPPACTPVQLPPGRYTKRVEGYEWSKLHKCRQRNSSRANGCVEATIVTLKDRMLEPQVTSFTVSEKAAPSPSGPKPDNPKVTILAPKNGDQFAFNDKSPGILAIPLKGKADDCDEDITWEMEDVGYCEKTIKPATGDEANATFRGLPENNSDFGRKKITARACGNSDSVTVEVFYAPKAANHPGEGSAVTPNWFYYWGQTSAGRGFDPVYEPERKSSHGGLAQAQYDYGMDKVVLTNQVFKMVCFPRPKVGSSEGIDCYAEMLRHETCHKKQRWEWWGDTNPEALGFVEARKLDLDGDLVPDAVEETLASRGCSKWDPTSCNGRPDNSLLDVEMDAYQEGWKWPVGSANAEDWSSCLGKQWKKGKNCQ